MPMSLPSPILYTALTATEMAKDERDSRKLDMRDKIEAFEKEKIDLECVLSLTENQLQRLGVTTLGDIHKYRNSSVSK